jgi:hypothetical protein
VQGPEIANDSLDGAAAIVGTRYVRAFEECAGAAGFDFVRRRFSVCFVHVENSYRRAFAGEKQGGRAADAGGSARD